MILAIEGSLGKGKTLFMSFLGLLYHLAGYKVITTYHVAYKHERLRTIDQLQLKFEKAVLLLDDSFFMLDSRTSQSYKNKFISQALLSSRKKGFDILYTQQYAKLFDIRLRQITDAIAYPNFQEDNIYEMNVFIFFGEDFFTLRLNPSLCFNLYNTNEIVNVEEMELQSKRQLTTNYIDQLDEYLQDINYDIDEYSTQQNNDNFILFGFDRTKLNQIYIRQHLTSKRNT